MNISQYQTNYPSRFMPILLLALVLFAAHAAAQPSGTEPAAPPPAFDTADYATVLGEFVGEAGLVDYAGLKTGRAPLDRFVASLAKLDPARFAQFSEDEKIAFWINAYNALTLQLIIDNYPIKASGFSAWRFPNNSIRQIAGVWEKPTWEIMGRQLSLHDIEHNILRKEFTRPGIHMGLNCASVGCPPLRAEPFTGRGLRAQLDEMAARFMQNPEKFRIDRGRKRIHLSPIFKWFTEDWVKAGYHKDSPIEGFGEDETAILEYLRQRDPGPTAQWEGIGGFKISWLDYDWSLNEQ